jgi:hypothetical protein
MKIIGNQTCYRWVGVSHTFGVMAVLKRQSSSSATMKSVVESCSSAWPSARSSHCVNRERGTRYILTIIGTSTTRLCPKAVQLPSYNYMIIVVCGTQIGGAIQLTSLIAISNVLVSVRSSSSNFHIWLVARMSKTNYKFPENHAQCKPGGCVREMTSGIKPSWSVPIAIAQKRAFNNHAPATLQQSWKNATLGTSECGLWQKIQQTNPTLENPTPITDYNSKTKANYQEWA